MNESSFKSCPLCNEKNSIECIGDIYGKWSRKYFTLLRCKVCFYAYLADPLICYNQIYNEDYYSGFGADPLVNYLHELENPRDSVRRFEWDGIIKILLDLVGSENSKRWLDYGCGNGCLVREGISRGWNTIGYDEGWITNMAQSRGIPILNKNELDNLENQFDIITAIEVFEHLVDPVSELKKIRKLIKKGGVLFFTTGNARPYHNNLLNWSYASIPEVHVGFFEPKTIATALEKAGFKPYWPGYLPGYSNIIKFKILKVMRYKHEPLWAKIMPWHVLSRLVDAYYGVTRHPVGIAI